MKLRLGSLRKSFVFVDVGFVCVCCATSPISQSEHSHGNPPAGKDKAWGAVRKHWRARIALEMADVWWPAGRFTCPGCDLGQDTPKEK